jgi:eukaryotic-like serine/threonine-protein kinase
MHADIYFTLQPGTLINHRYRLLSKLGQGSAGVVWLAEHTQLKTLLAIKAITPRADKGISAEEALKDCAREGQILVRLNHPLLPRVFDAFVENGRFFLVMEYLSGTTLAQQLRCNDGEPLPVSEVIPWGIQLADVLAYLHRQTPAIIFRDIKPANIMLQADGTIRLIDFGIARHCTAEDTHAEQVGSVGYSPPEQYRPQLLDPRADIYALGATLHHLLTGRLPAERPFVFPPAHYLNPNISPALSELLESCLCMEPNARPESMTQVGQELAAIRDMMSAQVPTGKLPPLILPQEERNPVERAKLGLWKGIFAADWRQWCGIASVVRTS